MKACSRLKALSLCLGIILVVACEKEVIRSESSGSSDTEIEKTLRVREPRLDHETEVDRPRMNSSVGDSPFRENSRICENLVDGVVESESFPPADHPCGKEASEILEGDYVLKEINFWATAPSHGVASVQWLHPVELPGVLSSSDPIAYDVRFAAGFGEKLAVNFPIGLPARILKEDAELSFDDFFAYEARVATPSALDRVSKVSIEGPGKVKGVSFYEFVTEGSLVEGNVYAGQCNFTRVRSNGVILDERADNEGEAVFLQEESGRLILYSRYYSIEDREDLFRSEVLIRLTYERG